MYKRQSVQEVMIRSMTLQKLTMKNKGFTLVETLVSIAILSSIVALMVVMSGNRLNEASSLKENLVAEYLAEEALEVIRNLRDTYYLSNQGLSPEDQFNGFISTVSQCVSGGNTGCSVNSATLSLTQCTFNDCIVYSDPQSGYYGDNNISGMVRSPFNRYVTLQQGANPVSIDIEVVVENKNAGGGGSVKKTVTINDQLWAWQ